MIWQNILWYTAAAYRCVESGKGMLAAVQVVWWRFIFGAAVLSHGVPSLLAIGGEPLEETDVMPCWRAAGWEEVGAYRNCCDGSGISFIMLLFHTCWFL
jgi:hypothetical protein